MQADTRTMEFLLDTLETIYLQAEGHKTSVAYLQGQNIALANIATIARLALAKHGIEYLLPAEEDDLPGDNEAITLKTSTND